MAIAPFNQVNQQNSLRTVGRKAQGIFLMMGVTLLLFGALGGRLAYLQLVQGERNRQLAENNRIRLIPKQPERGRILDRHGRTLAGSQISFSALVWPLARTQQNWPQTLEKLSQILKIPKAEIEARLEAAGDSSPTLVRVARNLSPAQITAIAEYSLEGVTIDAEAVRVYPHGKIAAHVLGYTGEVTQEQLDNELKDQNYRLSDVIGQMGAEAAFESRLRGEWGGQQVEVDGMGQVIRILGEKPARAGNDIHLTLDLDVQKAAEAALGNTQGAIVVIDPKNGAVLAMVSRPAFDPNIFSRQITEAQWQALQREDNPFVNRALRGFPPASTFKIVTATAALESGTFSPDTVLPTFPYVVAGGIQFWDWNRAGFGPLDFVGAMAWSSDTFFYQTAMAMKEEPLIHWTRQYGFGSKTGIEITREESSGLVPDAEWKRSELDEGWFLGDTINMSIGQGYLQATPLQVAVMFAVVANGGDRVKPHLLKDDEESQSWRQPLNLKPSTVRILKQGLRAVITQGTGTALNVESLPPNAGKTGTAEDPPRKSHAWYGGYAPFDNPEILVVAFAENSGGGGGSIAAPMVRQVMEEYFRKKKTGN